MDMEEEVGIMHIVINSNNHSKKYIVDPPQITYNEGFKKREKNAQAHVDLAYKSGQGRR